MQEQQTIDTIFQRIQDNLLKCDSEHVFHYCADHKIVVAISEENITLDFVFNVMSPNNLRILDCGADRETHLYVPHDRSIMQLMHKLFSDNGYELLEIVYNDPHSGSGKEIVIYLQVI